jgi:CBS-domain-containing membrane protein
MTLDEAAEFIREANVGVLPVVDNNRLIGILTDRDIVVRAVALGDDPASISVSEVMTPEPVCVFEDDSIEVAADVMSSHGLRRLPVIDHGLRVVGILSLSDLAGSVDGAVVQEVLLALSESRAYSPHAREGRSTHAKLSALDRLVEPARSQGQNLYQSLRSGVMESAERARHEVEE